MNDPAPWLRSVRLSHDRLAGLVEPLDPTACEQGSYCSEWTIAQVLSHLGSGAEIFTMYLEAGLSGEEPPGPQDFPPIWDAWNARQPVAQVADGVVADRAITERFEGLTSEERGRFHVALYGMELDLAGLLRMRLAEHALHTWDVAVALDAANRLAPDAVELLVDTLPEMAGYFGRPSPTERRVDIRTSEPPRELVLSTGGDGGELLLEPAAGAGHVGANPTHTDGAVSLPAESLLRLVAGRLDPAHTDGTVQAEGVELDELRALFPGV